jgi:hypothetical protein
MAWKTETIAFSNVLGSPPAGGSIAVVATTCIK